MESIVKLYSDKPGEISSFLNKFLEFKASITSDPQSATIRGVGWNNAIKP